MALLDACTRIANRSGRTPPLGVWRIVFAFLLFAALKSAAQTTTSPEYQVKAVFLYNFAQFVDWPPEAFPGGQAPLVIGVLGDDPFGAYLDETVRGERVKNRSLIVQRYRGIGEVKACHMLFLSRSEDPRLEQILASLKGRNILTVGDTEEFSRRGGMIRFVTEKGKVRMRINLGAVKAARLTISSKLLRVAEVEP